MPRTHSELYLHIVFATKNRLPFLQQPLRNELFRFLGGVIQRHSGIALAIGGMPDHVHLLVRIRPSLSVAELVKALKGSSSRWIKESEFEPPDRLGRFGWQEGYAVLSVSPSQVPKVRRYIENQEHHHRDLSSEDEFRRLTRGPPGGEGGEGASD